MFDLDGMRVTTAEMTHSMYDLAYRFDVEGKSVVVSGDTAFDPRLIALVRAVPTSWSSTRILGPTGPGRLRLAGLSAELPAEYQVRVPYRGDPAAPNHMPLPDVVRVATEAGVGTVVLTHLWPLPVDAELIERTEAAFVAGGFKGQVVFAEDGLEVAV